MCNDTRGATNYLPSAPALRSHTRRRGSGFLRSLMKFLSPPSPSPPPPPPSPPPPSGFTVVELRGGALKGSLKIQGGIAQDSRGDRSTCAALHSANSRYRSGLASLSRSVAAQALVSYRNSFPLESFPLEFRSQSVGFRV